MFKSHNECVFACVSSSLCIGIVCVCVSKCFDSDGILGNSWPRCNKVASGVHCIRLPSSSLYRNFIAAHFRSTIVSPPSSFRLQHCECLCGMLLCVCITPSAPSAQFTAYFLCEIFSNALNRFIHSFIRGDCR